MTKTLTDIKREAREDFAKLAYGRTLNWFESENGKAIVGARLDEYADRLLEEVERVVGSELEHPEFCRVRGEMYKECARCYVERAFAKFKGA